VPDPRRSPYENKIIGQYTYSLKYREDKTSGPVQNPFNWVTSHCPAEVVASSVDLKSPRTDIGPENEHQTQDRSLCISHWICATRAVMQRIVGIKIFDASVTGKNEKASIWIRVPSQRIWEDACISSSTRTVLTRSTSQSGTSI
jgi:hypothetical protein